MIVNVFIIFISTVYLSCHQSLGSPSQWSYFNVTQPEYQTVNQDGSASISCEHDAPVQSSSILDVRLNRVSEGRTSMLCQKGMEDCENIVMYPQYPNKCLFILLNLGPEDMDAKYQCEFTVKKDDIDKTKKGNPTRLRPERDCVTPPPPSPPPPPAPAPQLNALTWILIGLMALFLLYGCVITCIFIRLRVTNQNQRIVHENSTYVEMRKAPLRDL
ncbi:uncharacterized protein LOC133966815 [Platichthys flesus]|uniref:uncharacterized protein LOC133966815 n=1 Tax=Platichthys flesus TaxID=8260 RepID=UPI002DBB9694|nr:uncharacterized protein LOC133966815 [Platichthys flesus]